MLLVLIKKREHVFYKNKPYKRVIKNIVRLPERGLEKEHIYVVIIQE